MLTKVIRETWFIAQLVRFHNELVSSEESAKFKVLDSRKWYEREKVCECHTFLMHSL